MSKKSSTITDIKNILALAGKYRNKMLLLFVLYSIGNALIGITISFATKNVVDYFVDKVPGSITMAVASVGLLILAGGVMLPVAYYYSTMVKAKVLNSIRTGLFDHLQHIPASYFDTHHSGDTLARVNKDINALSQGLGTIEDLTWRIVSFLMIIPYITILDYRIGLIAFGLGAFSMIFNLKFRMPIREKSREVHKKSAVLSEQLTENVTGFKIIKTYGLSEKYFSKYRESVDEVITNELKITWLTSFLHTTNSLIGWLSRGGIALVGCLFVIDGSLMIGTLMGSIFIASDLSRQLVGIGELLATIQKSLAGSDRIYELLEVAEEPGNYRTVGTGEKEGLAVENGCFSYTDGPQIINSLDICVPKGKIAALVGYSGGGKSTIVKLLMGLYELESGAMTVNGRAVSDYSLDELRDTIAYVPQGAYVFNGTIRENIMYGRPDASEDEMITAAKKANAHNFIIEQVNQYDTVVGERGIRLSGGQRQRVAIARVILKDAPVLLLDEATSSLDSESEYLIQDALDKLMKGRTSLVVAHRLSTIEHADIIYFIEDGHVIEKGNHLELLNKKGLYSELYNREFIQKA